MQYEFDFDKAMRADAPLPSPSDSSNPKDIYGIAKPGLSAVPPLALFQIGRAMEEGQRKYGHMNWRHTQVKTSVYYNAAMRHLMAWWDGEDTDHASGLPHLALAAANLCILLDADSDGRQAFMEDDRPLPGFLNEFLSDHTKKAR